MASIFPIMGRRAVIEIKSERLHVRTTEGDNWLSDNLPREDLLSLMVTVSDHLRCEGYLISTSEQLPNNMGE